MKLDLLTLHQFATGCAGWDIAENAWRAHRVPSVMWPSYDQEEKFRIRMACPSCVRVRFHSDTRKLRLEMRYGAEARAKYQGELLIDGQPRGGFGPTERCGMWEGSVFEQPTRQKRLLDLWLPHLCQAEVIAIEVEDGCTIEPAPQLPIRWLVYGDSIMQGMTATLPTLTVVGRCALALNAEAQNLALGSAKLDDWLADAIPDGSYDVVSVAFGTNDYYQSVPVTQFQQNARRLMAALFAKQPERPVVLLTPLTWANLREPNTAGFTLDHYRESLVPLAKEFPRVRIVPGTKMIPDEEQWFVDQVHPNDQGFEIYAKNLLPHLRAVCG